MSDETKTGKGAEMDAGKGCSVARWIRIDAGQARDYGALAGFHYRGGVPRGVTRVFVARCEVPVGVEGMPESARLDIPLAGIVVEARPGLACMLRQVALPGRFSGGSRLVAARLNREMRTIARVVIHPLFRGTGLAVRLVRQVLATAETPYVEALAAMGRVHPFFERAGMRAFDRPPLANAVRLTAALEREGLRAMDLAELEAGAVSPFLAGELRHFVREKGGSVGCQLAEARRRLLSQPVYYLWAREAIGIAAGEKAPPTDDG